MATLPFVVQPKKNIEKIQIGDDESGVLEIVKKGYLTVAEKSFVDNVMQGSDTVSSIVLLANKISRDKKVSSEKAYLAISRIISSQGSGGLDEIISEEYSTDISSLTGRMAEAMARRNIAAATILIQTRVNHEWSVEDTLGLHPKLVEELVALYEEEANPDAGDKKKTEQEELEEAADVVGKSTEENTKQ